MTAINTAPHIHHTGHELAAPSGPDAPPVTAIHMIATDRLLAGDSPRLDGPQSEHVQLLAQSPQAMPPVLVHRSTMRVIDGMHRLLAARLRGDETISVRFYDGSPSDAFILSVQSNVKHGLPLSLADRTAAASRILRTHPHFSDRAIATAAGLSAKTVASLRRRAAVDDPTSASIEKRLGRDGKSRPIDSSHSRELAKEFISSNPQASLRQIAQVVGLSTGTIRDVRDRLRRGEPAAPARAATPAPQSERPTSAGPRSLAQRSAGWPRHTCVDPTAMLANLRKDPSLRYTEAGRHLLRLLDFHVTAALAHPQLIERIPAHCAGIVAEVAAACAESWTAFAEQARDRYTISHDEAVDGTHLAAS